MTKDKKYSVKKVLLWYWRTLPRYRWFYVGIFLFYGAGTLTSHVLSPIFFKHIIDELARATPDVSAVWHSMVWLGVTYVAFFVSYRIGDFFYAFVEVRAIKELARYSFEKLQTQSYEFFTRESAGSLIAKSSRFVSAFEELLADVTYSFWGNILKFLGIISVLLYLSPILAGAVFVWTILLFLVSYPFLKKSWYYDNRHSETTSKVTERFADVITNALTVKIFSAFDREKIAFKEVTENEAQARKKAWTAFLSLISVQAALILLVEFGGIALVLWLWQQGEVSIGTVVLVLTYMLYLFDIIWNVSRNIGRFLRHLSRASEMIEIFELRPSVQNEASATPFRVTKGEVEFQNVSFAYKEGKRVFENFTLVVKTGEKVGLVGPSGAGKSTITKLLLRFFDPTEGKVLIDGQDIRFVTQDALRAMIGYVPQEALLFHRPVGENIAYGKPGATQAEIEEAARKAEAHDFISHLAKKYDTLVGDRGVKLSGGERQRIAIARAILKNAPILILDEATSSLDSTSEIAIKKALDELMKGKTAIVIAHRLSTIQKMDRIVVLNKAGKIEEMGTHAELLAKNGLYANLWNHQAGGFIDEDALE